MQKNKRLTLIMSLFFLFLIFFSQSLSASREAISGLVYAEISSEMAPVVAGRAEPLVNYLSEVTGLSVDFYLTTNYAVAIEAILEGWVDIVRFGALGYVLAKERDPSIVPLATFHKESMPEEWILGGIGYTSILVTKKDSPYDTIESLRGTTLGIPDPASTSGYLLPSVVFTEDELGGEPLESFFGETVVTGGADALVWGILEERIEAGFLFDALPRRLWVRGELDHPTETFNLLWRSPVVPGDIYVARGDLPNEVIQDLIEAFLTWHEQPEAADYLDQFAITHLTSVTDEDYNIIRLLQEAQR